MKYIFRGLTLISALAVIGTIGAFDNNSLTLGQALLQFSVSLLVFYTSVTSLQKLENHKSKHRVPCRKLNNVTVYNIKNINEVA